MGNYPPASKIDAGGKAWNLKKIKYDNATNAYLFKVNDKNTKKGVKYVQSWQ